VRAVLFDALGTLVALQAPGPKLVRELSQRYGIELAAEDAERAFRAEILYYRAHHREGHDEPSLAALRSRCAEVLRAQLPPVVGRALSLAEVSEAMLGSLRFDAYPDALSTLAELRARGLALVAVSNWDSSLPDVLRGLELEPVLDATVTSAQVGRAKPDPAIFLRALELVAVRPEEALHVGDSLECDVQGARAAGIRAILLRREPGPGGSLAEMTAPGDAHVPARDPGDPEVISSLTQLLSLL
jgi:putative hydrolase of the HAD superfamily